MKFLPFAILLLVWHSTAVLAEVKLDSLVVGGKEYNAVTVTLDSDNRAKIIHESGIARVFVSELPADLRKKLGWVSNEEKTAAFKAKLEEEYPIASVTIPISKFSDNKVRDELNQLLDSKPEGKVFALTIKVTENPNQQQFIKIIFDKSQGVLLHMRRSFSKIGNFTRYDLVKWSGVNREMLRQGVPWMDENSKPLGRSENGTAPLNLLWSCEARPEIAEWP
jgi:hypothetical protein